jgi:expansin (peptidoglycan-binding protein)
MSSAFLQEYNFLRNVLKFYMDLLHKAPSGNNGGNLITPIQFDANARAIDDILLNIEGIVAFIYYGAYQQSMPSITGPVSQAQANNIYAIYDALGATRPILNIV